MKNKAGRLVILASMALAGCATTEVVTHHQQGAPLLYGGTRLNLASLSPEVEDDFAFSGYGLSAPRYPLLDLPFSLVADTLFLFPSIVTSRGTPRAIQESISKPDEDNDS